VISTLTTLIFETNSFKDMSYRISALTT